MGVPTNEILLISSDGATTYDVTAYVKSVSIDRGRSRELDKFEAGTFSVAFENRNRYFDPQYTDSTTRVNLHTNPSADINVSGYAGNAMTITRSTLYSSANVLGTCTSTGTGRYIDYSRLNVTQNNTYTFSVSVYFPAGNASDATVRLELHPFNGTAFGAPTTSASQVITRGVWTRLSVTTTATTVSGLPTTSILPRVNITSSFPSGNTMHIDGSLFEQASTAGTYFDGGFTDTNYQFYSWNGTAGLSTSTLLEYATPFYGLIKPNVGIWVQTEGLGRIWGFIKDWNLMYDVSGESTAVATGADAFSFLAQQETSSDLTPAQQTAGNRIGYVLSQPDVSWPYGGPNWVLDTTNTREVQSHTISKGTNILEYAQLVERTEGGFFFVNHDGVIEFQKNGYELDGGVLFTDDGTDIPYQGVEIIYGSELLYNTIKYTRLGGTLQTATDATSIAAYGISVYDQDGLLYVDDTSTYNAAVLQAIKYKDPEYRFDTVTVLLNGLSNADQQRVLVLDLCTIVQVRMTPNSVGTGITKYARIIGISEKLEVDSHTVTFRLETLDNEVLTLDSDVSGLLDYNVLGF